MELLMAARRVLAEEAPFAAARAAVEDAQLRSDELRFSELQPRSYHEAAQLQAVRQKIQRLRVQAAGAYHQDPDIYGDDGAWLGLRGSCFDSPPLTEKSVRGGVEARDGAARSGCPHTGPRGHVQRRRAGLRVSGVSIQKRDATGSGPPRVEAGYRAGRGQEAEAVQDCVEINQWCRIHAVTPSSRRRVDGVGGAVKFDFYTGPRRPNLLSWGNFKYGL